MQKRNVMGALVLGLTGLLAGPASAQEAVQASAGATSEGQEDSASEGEKDPMGWIGIGLKIGAGGNGQGEFEAGGVKTTIDSRAGMQLSIPINMGGDGFGWMLEPYLNVLSSVKGMDAATLTVKDMNVTTFGLYTGPTINIHVMDPLYIAIGAGLKLGYSTSDAFDLGLDVFGRVPVTGTWYFMEDIAAVAELGLGYGLTGYAAVPYTTTDPSTGQPTVVEPELEFGSALTWDFSVGARWP
jgi:hypothetical protein